MIEIIVIVEMAIIIPTVETVAGTAEDIVQEIVHAAAAVRPVPEAPEDALVQQVLWGPWGRLARQVRQEQWG